MCHLSNHPRKECECGCGGCECVHKWDDYEPPAMPLFTTVPGGHNDTAAYRAHMDFDKGLDAYAEARSNGLEPNATTLEAVNKAKAEALSEKRALKKLSKVADTEGMKTKHKVNG